jgi:ABC-type polysaccharide/polyol phosphate export permease
LLFGGLAMAALSLMGNVVVFRIRLGLSSAMFCSALMLVGMQVIMFGVSAAIVNRRMGWTEADRVSQWFQRRFTLERGIVGGLLILLAGLLLGLAVVVMLFERSTAPSQIDVPLTRMAIIAVFLTLFGIQAVFGAFYVSFLDVGKTLK